MGRTNLLIFGVLQQKSFQTQSSQTYKLSKSKGKKPLKNRWKHKLCAHIWFPQQQKLSPKIIWNCRPTIHRGNLQSPVNPKFSHLHLQGFGAFHMIENLPKVKKLSYTSNLKLSSCWMIPIIWNNNQNGLKCSITTPCSTRKSGISVAPSDPAFWTPLLGQRLSRHLCLTTFAILRRCPTSCAFKWRHSRWVEWGCFALAQKNCVMNRLNNLKWLNKGCDKTEPHRFMRCQITHFLRSIRNAAATKPWSVPRYVCPHIRRPLHHTGGAR